MQFYIDYVYLRMPSHSKDPHSCVNVEFMANEKVITKTVLSVVKIITYLPFPHSENSQSVMHSLEAGRATLPAVILYSKGR